MKNLFEYLISNANKKKVVFTRNKVQKGFMFENGDIIAITGYNDLYVFITRELAPDNYQWVMGKDDYGIFVRTRDDNIMHFDGWFMISPNSYNEKLIHSKNRDLSIRKLWRAGIDPLKYSTTHSLSKFCKNGNLLFEKD